MHLYVVRSFDANESLANQYITARSMSFATTIAAQYSNLRYVSL